MLMTLSKIQQVTGGQLTGTDATIEAVVIDSRLAKPASLFVAIKGISVDGHDYLQQALDKGASGALVEKHVDSLLPQVKVEDCVIAMADMAREYRKGYTGTIISITGSSGKTSTKEMLVSILSSQASVIATQGNRNNEIGVPLTIFDLANTSPFAVVEMGAAQKGDISYLMQIAQPDITVITNVGAAHIGRFGSEKIIADTKAEIYKELKPGGKAIVNLDDKYASQWLALLQSHPVKTYSLSDHSADIHASSIKLAADGSCFVLHHGSDSITVNLAVPGLHNVANALCAAACALTAGLTIAQAGAGLDSFVSVSSRLQALQGFWGGILIDDCYNANPLSVRAAIDVLAMYKTRKILVLGDMAELGSNSIAAHEDIGSYAREQGISRLYSCGVDSALAAKAFGGQAMHFSSKALLVDYLKAHVSNDDVVLVKGSRSAALEEVVQSIMAKVAN